jgi:plastocyanin
MVGIAALLTAATVAAAATLPPPLPRTQEPEEVVTVEIDKLTFRPDTVRVEVGQAVRWVNRESVPHTVVSGTVAQGRRTTEKQPSGLFESPNLDAGDSFEFTVRSEGTIAYYCGIHPFMTGTIIVSRRGQ